LLFAGGVCLLLALAFVDEAGALEGAASAASNGPVAADVLVDLLAEGVLAAGAAAVGSAVAAFLDPLLFGAVVSLLAVSAVDFSSALVFFELDLVFVDLV
jgi:hypothetical protein